MNLLNLFGFGPSFRNWIFTLYSDAYMQIIVNDFLTSPVKLSRGVRQGDALPPMLYVLCVEVLACTIRNSSQIEGFLLPDAAGAQFKVSQYADDTTVFDKDECSLVYLFKAISLYEKGSGARLNISKTKAMWLGNWKDRCDKPLALNWVDKMKVLGIVFGNVNVERDNWEPRLSKVDKMLSLWRSRSLSLVGKVLILNTLAFSKLFYLSRILEPPKWVYGRIKSLIWPFLWRSRIDTVARRSIICSLEDGGLGLRDFACQNKSFRLAAFVNVLQDSSAKLFFSLNIFVDLSWLQSHLIGPFYATILLLVLRDRRCFTLVYFRNCAPLISLFLPPLRQKHFTPCFCSGLCLCQSCRTTGLLMFLRVFFFFSRIGNRCVILSLKTLRMILPGRLPLGLSKCVTPFAVGVILPPPGAHLAPGWRQLTIAFCIIVVLSQFGFIFFPCFLLY